MKKLILTATFITCAAGCFAQRGQIKLSSDNTLKTAFDSLAD